MTGKPKARRVLSEEGRRRVAEGVREYIHIGGLSKQGVFGESRKHLYYPTAAPLTIHLLCDDYASAGLLSQEFLAESEELGGLEEELGERVRVQIKEAADDYVAELMKYTPFQVPHYCPSEESFEEYKERLITYLSETIRRTQERVSQLNTVKEHMDAVSDDIAASLDDIGSRLWEASGKEPSQQDRELGLEYIGELKSAVKTYGAGAEGRAEARLSMEQSRIGRIFAMAEADGAVNPDEPEAAARAAVESLVRRESEVLRAQRLQTYLEDYWADILAEETAILKRLPWPFSGRYRINEGALTGEDASGGVMDGGVTDDG